MLANYLDPNYDPTGSGALHDPTYGGTYGIGGAPIHAMQASQGGGNGGTGAPGDGGNGGGGGSGGAPPPPTTTPPPVTTTGAGGGVVLPSYPIDPYTPGQYGGPGMYNVGSPDPFVAPNAADIANDPGYQFRLQQGKDAMEHSAAARGTLLTGGLLKDLDTYGQGLASEEYASAYQRALGTWQATEYQPWAAANGWNVQQAMQANGIDFNAYQAWVNAQLAQTGIVAGVATGY